MSEYPPPPGGPADENDPQGAGTPPPPYAAPNYGPPPYGSVPSGATPFPGDPLAELALPTDVLGRPLSGWWKRALAFILDGMILAIPESIISKLLFGSSVLLGTSNGRALSIRGSVLVFTLLWGVLSVAYFALLNGGAGGQTLGQMVLGITVRDQETGGPIGTQRGAMRILTLEPGLLLTVIPLLGALASIYSLVAVFSPLWDARRQGFHDKVAKTQVVDVR